MNDQSQRLMRAITGPIILITVGVLFTIDRFTPFTFHQTWPVLLIVVGILKLLRRTPPAWGLPWRQLRPSASRSHHRKARP